MKTKLLLTSLVLGALAVACGESTPAASTSDDNIVGGVAANGKTLDAIGYLYSVKADGTGGGSCSATLIAPNLVLTAKHCVLADLASGSTQTMLEAGGKLGFRLGSDARASTRDFFAASVQTCALGTGGTAGLGCDVAVIRLSDAVMDVTPITVAPHEIGSDLVGQNFTAVGFGTQDAPSTIFGTRKMASLKLQATTGPGLHATFPTYDAFASFVDRTEGPGFASQQGGFYQQRYDQALLDGYEAQLGGADGNAQVCHGDSGGPLLKVIDGKLMVWGVASTVVSGVKQVCINAGAVYATFGPDAQALFATAAHDPCEGIPTNGCDGDTAVRCSRADEGERRILRTDCSMLAQRCDAAACVD